jgi:hypothetical protein
MRSIRTSRRSSTVGGKLLQYHGWADPGIPPLNSIGYYESVRGAVIART